MDSARRNKKLKADLEKHLLAKVDAVLPPGQRTTAQRNGAGKRSVGMAGRSSNDILNDCTRFLAQLKAERALQSASECGTSEKRGRPDPSEDAADAQPPEGAPQSRALAQPTPVPLRSMLMSSRSLFCLEVHIVDDSVDWQVDNVGQGAEALSLNSAGRDIRGQSLRDFVHPDDMEQLLSLRNHPQLHDAPISQVAEPKSAKVRLLCFGADARTGGRAPKFVPLDLQMFCLPGVPATAKRVSSIERKESGGRAGGEVVGPTTAMDDRVPMLYKALLIAGIPANTFRTSGLKRPASLSTLQKDAASAMYKEGWGPMQRLADAAALEQEKRACVGDVPFSRSSLQSPQSSEASNITHLAVPERISTSMLAFSGSGDAWQQPREHGPLNLPPLRIGEGGAGGGADCSNPLPQCISRLLEHNTLPVMHSVTSGRLFERVILPPLPSSPTRERAPAPCQMTLDRVKSTAGSMPVSHASSSFAREAGGVVFFPGGGGGGGGVNSFGAGAGGFGGMTQDFNR